MNSSHDGARIVDYRFEPDPDVVTAEVSKRTVEKKITTLAVGIVF